MKSIYICSSLRAEVYAHVSKVLAVVTTDEKIYRPQAGPAENRDSIVESDCYAIEHCDELWVIGEFGRDYSWEIGYAMGLGKIVKIFVDYTNSHFVEKDWMIHYGNKLGKLEIVSLIESEIMY